MSGRGVHGGGSGEGGRKKRAKPDEGSWDCTVCTFHNTADAFKCLMCDTRKGTSTRKPKLNSHLEEQVEQVVRQLSANQSKKPRLSLTRDVPSPPSPPSPFDRDFDDPPHRPTGVTSGKGKGIGKNKKGAAAAQKKTPAPVIEEDEEEEEEERDDEEDEEEEEAVKTTLEKKKKTAPTAGGKSTLEKPTPKPKITVAEKSEKPDKSEKAEKKPSSVVASKKEKEPKKGKVNAEKKEKDASGTTTTTTTTTTTAATTAAKKAKKAGNDDGQTKRRLHRLKNVDRSTANSMAVTVNNITVIITDFKPKAKRETETATTQSEKKIKSES